MKFVPWLYISLAAASTAQAADTWLSVSDLWIDAPTQALTLTYSADTGFPAGRRYAQTTLDCRTSQTTSRGYVYSGSLDPQFADEDKGAPAAILSTKLLNIGKGALSYKDLGAQPRFFCRNGVLVSDLSTYAKNNRARMFDVSYSDSNLNVSAGTGSVLMTVPAFTFRREDGKLATATIDLEFAADSLAGAQSLIGFRGNAPLFRPREAVFLLEKDGKTLRPLMYNGQAPGLRTTFPVKAGKSGTILTFYYTEDYSANAWQKAVVDLSTFQTYTTKTSRPANLKFGQ
ncbi:hypothetical protein [Deinococcus sp. PESE-13]